MMTDHLVDDEAQKLLAEPGVEPRLLRQGPQPGDLTGLAVGIGGGEARVGLVPTDRLGDLEAFGEEMDERSVDVVDARPVPGERLVGRPVRSAGVGAHDADDRSRVGVAETGR